MIIRIPLRGSPRPVAIISIEHRFTPCAFDISKHAVKYSKAIQL